MESYLAVIILVIGAWTIILSAACAARAVWESDGIGLALYMFSALLVIVPFSAALRELLLINGVVLTLK